VYFRRGWTHGPPAMLVLPVVLTALVVAFDWFVRQRRAAPPVPVAARGAARGRASARGHIRCSTT
jgi:hypothetical protein